MKKTIFSSHEASETEAILESKVMMLEDKIKLLKRGQMTDFFLVYATELNGKHCVEMEAASEEGAPIENMAQATAILIKLGMDKDG
jgi:hypothetical protein